MIRFKIEEDGITLLVRKTQAVKNLKPINSDSGGERSK